MSEPIIIIGGSIAGVSAAEAARRQDPDVDILILSSDTFAPYYRLRICEVFCDPESAAKLELHPRAWYDERKIRLETGIEVLEVMSESKQVRLSDGRLLSFSSLVIATGSLSFKPPVTGIDRPNVFTLWTMQDALNIAAALAKAKQVIVIGGGLLGLETAFQTRRFGLPVRIIEKMQRLLVNQLDGDGSSVLTKRVQALGIEVVTDADITEINDSGVRLADGREFAADLVLVSIGVRSNVDFLKGSGLVIPRRIATDARLQTNLLGIYAAGDVAEPDNYWFGLWTVARAEGLAAGTNATGGQSDFVGVVPPYVLNTMNTKVAVQGDQGKPDQPEYTFEITLDSAANNYRKLVYKDSKLCGYMLVGDNADFVSLQKQLIE